MPSVQGYAFAEGPSRGFVLALGNGYWDRGEWIRVPVGNANATYADHIVVTSDRVHWRAIRIEEWELRDHVSASARQRGGGPAAPWPWLNPTLTADRLMIAWAIKVTEKPTELYSMDAVKEVAARTMHYGHPVLDQDESNGVTYNGFETIAKRSAHTLEALHKTIVGAALDCHRAWGWRPRSLDVGFHQTSRAMGLAYAPGYDPATHKISLHVRMLETYDLHTIWRVLVHEFCHHYREEKWPRRGRKLTAAQSHDQLFCNALRQIDTAASDAETCRWFINVEDPALKAAKEERLAALPARAQRASPRNNPPVWSANAGYLSLFTLKSRKFRIEWVPRDGFHWSKYVKSISARDLGEIVTHFGPADWDRVEVQTSPRLGTSGWGAVRTLSGLVAQTHKYMPNAYKQIVEFMAEMRAKHAQATG
jgi:hypothetical protein